MPAAGMRKTGMKQPTHAETELHTTTLNVAGMSCGACVRHVTRALEGMSGVVHVDVNLRTNEVIVEHLPAFVDPIALIAAIRDAGYTARITGTGTEADGEPQQARGGSARPSGCCARSRKTKTAPDPEAARTIE